MGISLSNTLHPGTLGTLPSAWMALTGSGVATPAPTPYYCVRSFRKFGLLPSCPSHTPFSNTHTHTQFIPPPLHVPLLCYSFNILDVLGSLQALASTGIINQQNNPTGPGSLSNSLTAEPPCEWAQESTPSHTYPEVQLGGCPEKESWEEPWRPSHTTPTPFHRKGDQCLEGTLPKFLPLQAVPGGSSLAQRIPCLFIPAPLLYCLGWCSHAPNFLQPPFAFPTLNHEGCPHVV